MNLPSLSIRRPVFAGMLIGGLVVLGGVSLGKLDVDLEPEVELPYVVVTTVLRGASPDTVEWEITDVLEEQINTVEGIKSLRSTSSENVSRIFVEFELGYDVDVKAQQVRDRVSVARPMLPLDVEDPVVERVDPNAVPIVSVMLGGPVSIRELSEVAENVVAQRLERLPGVGSVTIVGAREREIRVWVDPVRLTGYGLSVQEVADTLRLENTELAGGRVEGSAREWAVTTVGKVHTVEDFGSLIVAQRSGHLVYLRDVAIVEDGMEEERSIARLNGQRGVSLEVRRQSGANTVAVARRIRAEIEELRPVLPRGMTITVAKDLATFIERSIESVFIDMIYGGFLAVLVVLLFLRNPRSTLIASLAIPSSVVSSFVFFFIAGFTLNIMTLTALSLSIGLLIDDAIVVLENIYRRMEEGEPRSVASEAGASQVGLAVVSTTLAVCAVFVPIAFMEGIVGQWFYEFGLVVAVAVSVSTLVALTLTPAVASLLLSVTDGTRRIWEVLERGHDRLAEGYRWLLVRAVRRKGVTVVGALVSVAAGCGVATTLPFDFYSSSDRGEFTVHVKFPLGTPLAVTNRLTREVEEIVASQPEVRNVFSTVGYGVDRRSNEASLYVGISPKSERDLSQFEIMDQLRTHLTAEIEGAEEIGVHEFGIIEFRGRNARLTYTLRGPDLQRLEGYARSLMAKMRADPLLVDVASSYETGKPEIALDIDRDLAADLGVPAAVVGRTIRTLLAGEKVGSFEDAGRRYDVRVQILADYRDDPSKLGLIHVRSMRGSLVPIPNVARVRHGEGAVEIHRENRARQITLYANLAAGVPLGDGARKLRAWADELGVQPPDEFVPVGMALQMEESGRAIVFAFVLALVAIYMVLASLFNSLIQPFTIMMSAPLSFIGGFFALKLAGMPLDLMSGIGLLVLMGLVMKNGILLVDYTNQLRAQGRSREEAILEAGPIRMRPVLMTTGALVFGMIPIAFGASSGAEFRSPMGMITIGGLLTSTLLTLVVVPVIYSLLDALGERIRRVARRAIGSGEGAGAGARRRAHGSADRTAPPA